MAVQDMIYTSNPVHEYSFSWTIQHLSFSPDVLRSPALSPILGYPEKVCMELQYKLITPMSKPKYHCLSITLIDMNVEDSQLIVSCYTMMSNTNNETLHESTITNTKLGKGIELINLNKYYYTSVDTKLKFCQQMNLKEDELIVQGKLSIACYGIASNVTSVNYGSDVCGDIVKDLKTIYQSGSSADITFYVGEKTLRAHKLILSIRSPVFAKMFDTDMVESKTNRIFIDDADFHVFSSFLSFIYTGIVEDKEWDTMLALCYLAHKYQVKSLHEICCGILGNGLTIESVCSVLVLANLHGDQKLKDVAKVFIRHHLQVVGTTEWTEKIMPKPHLMQEVLASLPLKLQ